jgi:glutamine cyclotransferase
VLLSPALLSPVLLSPVLLSPVLLSEVPAVESPAGPAVRRARVLARLPHPSRGFTQGLIVDDGMVWESTGLYGESALRRYRLGSDRDEECAPVPPELFAEGICRAGDIIWQLTWLERVALRWQPAPLALLETVPYNREGWGICHAGDCVVTSDGTSELVRRDPATLAPLETVPVRCAGQRVAGLNDLAWSGGLVWANVLGRPFLAGIDLGTGQVTEIADARKAAERHRSDPQAIMNGIAALPGAGEFVLTGKHWQHSYHVRLDPGRRHRDPARLILGASPVY